MTEENTVKLLWDCALALETHTNKLLKSYYINICRKISKNNVQMPKGKFAVSQMCPRCSGFWSENDFCLKLKPQNVARSAKAKKLIAKLNEVVSQKGSGILSKKQRRRAKWLKKRAGSSVEVQCENCKNKSQIPLHKPAKRPAVQLPNEDVPESPIEKMKKKKKAKHKDCTAGLKINPGIKIQTNRKSTKIQDTTIFSKATSMNKPSTDQIEHKITNQTKVLSSKGSRPEATSSKLTVNANLASSVTKKKKKNKKQNTATQSVPPTVQSKTQKKNSLLQLAALLKKKDIKSDTPQNRLQSLLK